MTTPLNGALGGLVAGALAGAAARSVAADPSVVAAALARTVRVRSRRAEFAVGAAYGALSGGLLVVLELAALGLLSVPPAAGAALGLAVGWSALLCGALCAGSWAVGLRAAPRRHLAELLGYHLVYGVALGVWIRATWIT